MAELRDVLAYYCENYPYQDELSNARLTKMVYLADWRSSLLHGRQITSIKWHFHHYGPFVEDILNTALGDPGFSVEYTRNLLGESKALIGLNRAADYPSLSDDDREILDFVIEKTSPLHWQPFMRLVYSTYPVATQQRYESLDLPRLAEEADELSELFDAESA